MLEDRIMEIAAAVDDSKAEARSPYDEHKIIVNTIATIAPLVFKSVREGFGNIGKPPSIREREALVVAMATAANAAMRQVADAYLRTQTVEVPQNNETELANIAQLLIDEFGPSSGDAHGFKVDPGSLSTFEFAKMVVRCLRSPKFKRKATNVETLELVAQYLRDESTRVSNWDVRIGFEQLSKRIVSELSNRSV